MTGFELHQTHRHINKILILTTRLIPMEMSREQLSCPPLSS